uniref:Uncharacterized protein n=1 Tax=uncultured prokaryote TaxID=198431 RepID=A0A0H5Q7E2_9ZZZZ|nr:hypothetical protein [uncultured prokaryote]
MSVAKVEFEGVSVRKGSLGDCMNHEDHIVIYLTVGEAQARRVSEILICPRHLAHAEVMNALHDAISEKLRSAWSNLPPDPLF